MIGESKWQTVIITMTNSKETDVYMLRENHIRQEDELSRTDDQMLFCKIGT